jgi:hypothetical protein
MSPRGWVRLGVSIIVVGIVVLIVIRFNRSQKSRLYFGDTNPPKDVTQHEKQRDE